MNVLALFTLILSISSAILSLAWAQRKEGAILAFLHLALSAFLGFHFLYLAGW